MKRVLVSQRVVEGPHGDTRDALEHTYVTFLERHGFTVLPVSNAVADAGAYMDAGIHGVVLTGGNDVGTSFERDRTEASLLRAAIERRVPVLGICRGMQFINVFFGGTLEPDLEQTPAWATHTPGGTHAVAITDEAARDALGADACEVNTFHRQAVMTATLAPALKVFAADRGFGVVEGLFHPELAIAGVQYHPERREVTASVDERLIGAFASRTLFWEPR